MKLVHAAACAVALTSIAGCSAPSAAPTVTPAATTSDSKPAATVTQTAAGIAPTFKPRSGSFSSGTPVFDLQQNDRWIAGQENVAVISRYFPNADPSVHTVLGWNLDSLGGPLWTIEAHAPADLKPSTLNWGTGAQIGDAIAVTVNGEATGAGMSNSSARTFVQVYGIADGKARGPLHTMDGKASILGDIQGTPQAFAVLSNGDKAVAIFPDGSETPLGSDMRSIDQKRTVLLRDGKPFVVKNDTELNGLLGVPAGVNAQEMYTWDRQLWQVTSDRLVSIVRDRAGDWAVNSYTQVFDAHLKPLAPPLTCKSKDITAHVSPSAKAASVGATVITDIQKGTMVCASANAPDAIIHAVADDGSAWVTTVQKAGLMNRDGQTFSHVSEEDIKASLPKAILPNSRYVFEKGIVQLK